MTAKIISGLLTLLASVMSIRHGWMGLRDSATVFLVLIAFALSHSQFKIALTEVPFLLVALLLIWLRHPLSR